MSTVPEPVPPPSFLEHPELPPGVTPPRARRPAWRPWTAWVALLAGVAATFLGATVVGVVGSIFGGDLGHPSPAMNIVATVVQDVCLVGSALLFARLAADPRPEQLGLRPTRLLAAIGWMAAALVAFYVITYVWVAIVDAHSNDDEVTRQLGVDRSTVALVAGAAVVTVVAPLAEELFFRGFFYGALRNWRGVWPAAAITGLVFGAVHAGSADVAYLLPLGFFGFALCLLYERTGSLYPCIALHCLNNSLAFGASQHWGWQIPVLALCSLAALAGLAGALRRLWPWPARAAPAPA
jgi:membrane protease YdiL (CAAX protease family)